MVKYSSKLDTIFAALSDPTRRAILSRLARGDSSVGELARPFDVSLPAVSRHLRVLQGAGLLTQDRQGRVRRCRLRAAPMRAAAAWIQRYHRFWAGQLDALAQFVEQTESESTPQERRRNDHHHRRQDHGRNRSLEKP